MNREEITIILPTLNEEESIGAVIDEIPRKDLENNGYDVRIVVADGNSTDQTRQIAEEKSAEVMIEKRRGKGFAVATVIDAVTSDYIIMLDADSTYPAYNIPEIVERLKHHDVVIGSRLKGRREIGSMTWLNLIGNRFLSMIATVIYLKKVSDVCSGYWGFKGHVVKKLHLRSPGFELEAEMFSKLARSKHSILELPIDYRCRSGVPKLNSISDGIKIGRKLITERFQRQPNG